MLERAQALLQRLRERAPDGHGLADGLHSGAEHVGASGELLERPAGHLRDHVVDGGLEAGGRLAGDVVGDLVERVAHREPSCDLGDRERVGDELAVARNRRVDGDAGSNRVFVVGVGVDLLRLFAGKPLDQLDAVGLVGRVLGQQHAGEIDVGAAAFEGRQDHLGGFRPRLLLGVVVHHQRPVIGVADADVALAGRDVARGFAVAARGLLRQVGLHAAQPFLGLGLAVLRRVGREQAVIVDVLAGADADLALPLGIGELFVGDLVLLDAILRGVDHTGAHRDAGPVSIGIAILRRHDLVDHHRLDRLGDAGLHGLVDAADVDRQQHVGGAVGAFRLHALLEARTRRDDVDLDAGVLGEGVEQRLDQLGFAIGVDVDLAVGGRRRSSKRGKTKQCRGCGGSAKVGHESCPANVMEMSVSVAQRPPCRQRPYVANASF